MNKVSVYQDDTENWHLIEADALTLLTKLPDNSIDAVVTDPPYAIGLGGAAWDRFGGNGTTSKAFEDWTQVWATEVRRVLKPGGHMVSFGASRTFHRLVTAVEDAGLEIRDQLMWLYGQGLPKSRRLPGGLGTTLKPAYEPILLARSPLDGDTISNIQRWGTGGLNIKTAGVGSESFWPANVTLSHSPDCPVGMIDGGNSGRSRLFFCAKASRAERETGCEQLPARLTRLYTGRRHSPRLRHNTHPTVKPVSLMRWLVRLVTPPGGLVLDPFTGSGTTGIAAVTEDRRFVGIERETEYVDIACARLTHHAHNTAEVTP